MLSNLGSPKELLDNLKHKFNIFFNFLLFWDASTRALFVYLYSMNKCGIQVYSCVLLNIFTTKRRKWTVTLPIMLMMYTFFSETA